MDWTTALTLPTAWFLIAALLGGIATLTLALECRQLWQRRAIFNGILSGLGLACMLLLSIWLMLGALALRGYQPISSAAPLATAQARILAPGRWALDLVLPDGNHHRITVSGDTFQLTTVIAHWTGSGPWARLPSLYRLDQLATHYDDSRLGDSGTINLTSHTTLELTALQRSHPKLLPGLSAHIETSPAALPLVDRGNYIFTLDPTGHLTGGPDQATAQKILRPL